MTIRIGLAQIAPYLGLPDRNRDLHLEQAERARAEGAELLVFPELSLTGYLLKDMVANLALRPDASALAPLLEASRTLDLVVGFVEEGPDYRHYNSLAYLAEGRVAHVHRKVYLPTYGMFEEQRYFTAGNTLRAFPTRFGRLALAVCEDIWHPSLPYLAFMDGALGLLVGSASPLRGADRAPGDDLPSNAAFWDRLLRHYASIYAGWVAFCNRCGVEDGTSFWGGSRLVGPAGERLAEAPLHEPALLLGELDLAALRRRRQAFSAVRDERPEVTFRGLERILRARAAGGEAP
ncbi:MAG: carbon-nitrogen hydrolase [Candidatus Krumholzibacteriota bacterium]|nr:carbon-nitrogen hydrolase [Candidatus Krumholzibacteriota bacterium]